MYKVKHNFKGYFLFFYSIVGVELVYNLFLCLVVGLLDGMGLAMFVPLLQSFDSSNTKPLEGNIQYIYQFFSYFNISLNIYSSLIVLVLMFSLKGLVRFFQVNNQYKLREKCIKKLNFDLTDSIQNLSYEGFLKLDAGSIQNALTTELSKLVLSVYYYLQSASMLSMLITYIFLAFVTNWQFAILVVLGAGITNLVFRKIFSSVKRASIGISKKGDKINSYLLQAIQNFKYLKATNHFKDYSIKLKNVIIESAALTRRLGFNQAITSSSREPLVVLIVALVIIIQIKLLGSSISTVIISLFLFYRALASLMNFQSLWQNFIQNIGSIDAIVGLANTMKNMEERTGTKVVDSFRDKISIENGTFFYGSQKILDGIGVDIPKNKTVAFVGESGSGKTTLANVVAGLYTLSSGSIKIDDHEYSAINLNNLRRKIGYISQEVVIFNDSIYNNITFWSDRSPANIERFNEVVKLTSIDSFIDNLPEKENTILGDNGITISGGQKQRISIARELYKKSEILILDEATSALDSETELFIQKNIERLHGERTIIIIAHRLSTIKNVDAIFLLENGKISAQGTYDDILVASPKFQRMVLLQEVR